MNFFKALPLSACLLVCLSACLLVCLSACLLVCLSACLLVRLSACLLVRLSACLLVCLSACLIGYHVPCRYDFMVPHRRGNARLRARGVRGTLPPGRGVWGALGHPREAGGFGGRHAPNVWSNNESYAVFPVDVVLWRQSHTRC